MSLVGLRHRDRLRLTFPPLVGRRIIGFQTAVDRDTEITESKTMDKGGTTVGRTGLGVSEEEKGRKAYHGDRMTSSRVCLCMAPLGNSRKILLLDPRVSEGGQHK